MASGRNRHHHTHPAATINTITKVACVSPSITTNQWDQSPSIPSIPRHRHHFQASPFSINNNTSLTLPSVSITIIINNTDNGQGSSTVIRRPLPLTATGQWNITPSSELPHHRHHQNTGINTINQVNNWSSSISHPTFIGRYRVRISPSPSSSPQCLTSSTINVNNYR